MSAIALMILVAAPWDNVSLTHDFFRQNAQGALRPPEFYERSIKKV
jgi:hypothetical protein